MPTVKNGDVVSVLYQGFLENGDPIDSSSEEAAPLQFRLGGNTVMPGFEKGVLGMAPGETKKISMSPEDGYGPRKEELIHTVSRSMWKQKQDIKPGVIVGLTMEKEGEKHQVPAMVTKVEDDQVTVDFNHPLAGQGLKYTLTLESIDKPPGI